MSGTRKAKNGKWTVRELEALKADAAGDTLADGEGLQGEVRLAADGVALSVRWRYGYRWAGKLKWHQCGTWPHVSMADIRGERDDARNKVASGINPADAKAAERIERAAKIEATLEAERERLAGERTVRELFDAWVAQGRPHKDGKRELKRGFAKDVLPALGERAVRSIVEADVLAMLKGIAARESYRQLTRIDDQVRSMFAWALRHPDWRPLLPKGNPSELIAVGNLAAGVDLESIRERVLAEAELVELARIFDAMNRDLHEGPGLTRSGLHALVWSRSMVTVARELGISDTAVRKACMRHAIPTPPAGWFGNGRKAGSREALPLPEPERNYLLGIATHTGAPHGLPRRAQLALWLLLATTCRPNELLAAEWWHVNLDKGEWVIPRGQMKAGEAHLVLLSDFARRCFEELHTLTGGDRFCFPGARVKKSGEPRTHVNEQWLARQVGDRQKRFKGREADTRACDDSLVLANGVNGDWWVYDLRRTSTTMLQALGVELDLIDRCQAHQLSGSKVRRHYMLYAYAAEKRAAWAKLGAVLEQLLERASGANVQPLPVRAA